VAGTITHISGHGQIDGAPAELTINAINQLLSQRDAIAAVLAKAGAVVPRDPRRAQRAPQVLNG
jgi:hypothetical protein